MKQSKVTCDNCNADLSDAGPRPEYRLVLDAERIPNSGRLLYAVYVVPAVDRQHHFCGLGCLSKWIEKKRNETL